MKVFDYIAHETERQSGTIQEAIGMYKAWQYISDVAYWRNPLVPDRVIGLAHKINGVTGFRTVPAVFNQGVVRAVQAELVSRAMDALCSMLTNFAEGPAEKPTADLLTREFLSIHPFVDGNGRVGSLIWNYLNRTLDDPEPMPYFFGENNG